jgi:dTDP-4-dehydrorhamnose 3,5-epimerase
LNAQTIDISETNDLGLLIPVGVAHGFAALTDVTLIYIVDNYFNGGRDENGIAWNDRAFNLDWGINDPILSERDLQNPFLDELPTGNLPD